MKRLPAISLIFCLVVASFAPAADKTRIAVMSLVAKAGVDPNTASTITDLLSGELVSLKKFDVIDRANLDKVMREQALQQSGCSDQACAVKLGNILNVQKLVVGSVSKLGSKIIITLSFVDVERSRIEMSENETAANDDELMPRIKSLAAKIDQKVSITGKVVSVKPDGSCLINIGRDDGLTAGTMVTLLRYGNAIIDQSTGDFLGREVAELGQAKVVTVDAGGTLSTIKAQKDAQTFKEGDRIILGAGSLSSGGGSASASSRPRAARPQASAGGDRNIVKPVVLISGLGVGVLGGVMTLVSYLQADAAYTAYKALGASTLPIVFTEKYNAYTTQLGQMTPWIVVGGVGAAILVTSFFIPTYKKTAYVYPTYDGERFALQFSTRF
jgi:TolB-like protein